MQALVDMIKVNTSIHRINLRDYYIQHDIYRESVIPYLETNRFRPRLLAIQKARPIPYRTKVLGRALLAARTDANGFWMLLSGNAEVAFPSKAAANLPTPATTASTATRIVASTITASVISSLTTNAIPYSASDVFASVPTAAAAAPNIATPSAGQKRKTYPFTRN
jgi:hypothetical protein